MVLWRPEKRVRCARPCAKRCPGLLMLRLLLEHLLLRRLHNDIGQISRRRCLCGTDFRSTGQAVRCPAHQKAWRGASRIKSVSGLLLLAICGGGSSAWCGRGLDQEWVRRVSDGTIFSSKPCRLLLDMQRRASRLERLRWRDLRRRRVEYLWRRWRLLLKPRRRDHPMEGLRGGHLEHLLGWWCTRTCLCRLGWHEGRDGGRGGDVVVVVGMVVVEHGGCGWWLLHDDVVLVVELAREGEDGLAFVPLEPVQDHVN